MANSKKHYPVKEILRLSNEEKKSSRQIADILNGEVKSSTILKILRSPHEYIDNGYSLSTLINSAKEVAGKLTEHTGNVTQIVAIKASEAPPEKLKVASWVLETANNNINWVLDNAKTLEPKIGMMIISACNALVNIHSKVAPLEEVDDKKIGIPFEFKKLLRKEAKIADE